MICRHCNTPLETVFCDLQTCPPSNAMVKHEQVSYPETYFPLKVYTCHNCWLVQVDEIEKAENIFNDEYTYFSSFSTSWLAHAKQYTDYMTQRFGYNENSLVVEIASNDGYLLQYFKEKNIPVLGVEPTANTAQVAIEKGIPNIVDFFGSQLAQTQLAGKADLILGNNVLAHVPDINDFAKGVKIALKADGVNTFEFPHLCSLVKFNQFDTIYHEHFSYLSLTAVKSIFEAQGLEVFDVQEITTHGGSLRVFAQHKDQSQHAVSAAVTKLLAKELSLGMTTEAYYADFQEQANRIKDDLIEFLINAKQEGKKVIGYGAAAKGNTLLNYAGILPDLLSAVVDLNPAKQNKYLPGSRIPIVNELIIRQEKPDYVLIFPWNLRNEVTEQLKYIGEWGGKFVTAVPSLEIS